MAHDQDTPRISRWETRTVAALEHDGRPVVVQVIGQLDFPRPAHGERDAGIARLTAALQARFGPGAYQGETHADLRTHLFVFTPRVPPPATDAGTEPPSDCE